jgi:serine/threonine protein phosphatase 1
MSKKSKETFVIGDVHGCYHTLLNLLKKLPKKSKLIFVGDLCDKGRYSKDVIEFVLQNGHICIKGNHEHLVQTYLKKAVLKGDMSSKWASRKGWGGKETIENYRGDLESMKRHLDWIKSLPLYYEVENFFITHGFGLPYYERKHQCSSKLFVNRIDDSTYMKDWEDFRDYKVINIFGHCNFKEVLRGKNYICIDTGCCYGNKLTALNLKTLEIVEEKTDRKDISFKL